VTPLVLAGTTFAASAVEFVEAATIVMAVGTTQGWRPALAGTAAATLALIVLVGAFSPLLANAAALRWIELIAGLFLILFGARWLRKVVLRYAGRIPMHDEEAIYAHEVSRLRTEQVQGFAVAFQGVFVEGLEVAIIVITFAATSPALIGWSSGGALCALLVVTLAAFALRAPFSRVPENALKAIVGIMLVSLGTLWTGEGLGVRWPWGDVTLVALLVAVTLVVGTLVLILREPSYS
jgi:Ca2+/H+ antiporter, TMEM165/GDT1 family